MRKLTNFITIFVLLSTSFVSAQEVIKSSKVISQPGIYLVESFTGYIEIKTDNVELMGNGNKVFRDSRSQPVIKISKDIGILRNVKIYNLALQGGNSGVIAHNCRKLSLEGLEITSRVGYAVNISVSNVDSSKIINCGTFGGMYGINGESFSYNEVRNNNINSNVGIYIKSGENNFGIDNADRDGGKIQMGQPENSFINVYNELPTVTTDFNFSQNYPNPFNPKTLIGFTIEDPVHVTLKVYNVNGQKIVTLVDGQKSSGEHKVNFDAGSLPSGIYFCHLQIGQDMKTLKMMKVQ